MPHRSSLPDRSRLVLRRLPSAFILSVAAGIVLSVTPKVSSQEGALGGLAGLSDLTRSFFAHDAYVGSRRFYLFDLRSRDRVPLTGFSVDAIDGDGWFRAAPHDDPPEDSIQEVWFVKDAHRFTAWANKRRIAARPLTAFARLRFIGLGEELSVRARVERFKRRDLASVAVVTLDTSDITVANILCARYSATVIDRGVPPSFDEQSFEVTEDGIVCPHPDAPGLGVEVGATQRRPAGEPALPRATELSTFIHSLQFTPLPRPRVADLFHSSVSASDVRIALTVARARSEGSQVAPAHPASGDLAIDQVVRYDGSIAAIGPNALWLAKPTGTVQRIDLPSGRTTIQDAAACRRPFLSATFTLTVERHGVWIGCAFDVAARNRQQQVHGYARLDPATGAVVATVLVKGIARDLHTTEAGVWALEQPFKAGDACLLHVIDSDTNRIARTLPVRTSTSCRLLLVERDGLWISRGRGRSELVNIEAATGTARATIVLPEGLAIGDLVIADSTSFWLSTSVSTYGGRGMAAFGTRAGLLRIDRRTSAISGGLVPTGLAARFLGAVGADVWLSDVDRTITRIAMD